MSKAKRIIRDYGDLVDAMRSRRLELGMSCMSLDARAGFQEGYANKLENWDKPYGRGLGPVSMRLWLEALGLAVIVVEVSDRAKPRLVEERQMSLDLVGGCMNAVLSQYGYRKGFKRVPDLRLVAA